MLQPVPITLGISAGTSSQSSGLIAFSNSNGISFGESNGTVTASYTTPTQTTQPAVNAFGVSNTGNTAGNTGTSSGITWVVAGSNNITASESTAVGGPNTVWISGPTTVAQTNQTVGIYAFDQTIGDSSSSTVDARSVSVDGLGAAGVGWFSSNSHFAVSVAQAVPAFGVGATGNTAGNTGTVASKTVFLAATGAVTVSQSTGAAQITDWISVAPQSTQPAVNALGVSDTGNAVGNTGTSSGITFVIAGSNGITASQSTTAGGPDTIWLSGLMVSIPAAGVSNTGNTLGNTGVSASNTVVFAASGAITASQSTAAGFQTIWYSVAAQTNQAGSIYAVGNTSGTSSGTYDARTLSISGAGAVTVAASNSGWIINVPVQTVDTGGVYARGNTFGTSSGTYDARTLSISATSGLQAAASNSGWVIADQPLSAWEPFPVLTGAAFVSRSAGTWYFQKFNLPRMLAMSNIVVDKSFNISVPAATSQASSGTEKYSYSHGFTFFSRQDYAGNSTNFTTVTTASFGLTVTLSYTSTAQSFAYSWVTNTAGGTTSFSTTSNSGNWSQYLTGPMQVSIPCVTTLTQGEYWVAHAHSSTTGTAGSNVTLVSVSDLGTEPQTAGAVGFLGTFGQVGYLIAGGPYIGTATAVTTNNTMPATVVSGNFQITNFCAACRRDYPARGPARSASGASRDQRVVLDEGRRGRRPNLGGRA
jgi:hypothetical protein